MWQYVVIYWIGVHAILGWVWLANEVLEPGTNPPLPPPPPIWQPPPGPVGVGDAVAAPAASAAHTAAKPEWFLSLSKAGQRHTKAKNAKDIQQRLTELLRMEEGIKAAAKMTKEEARALGLRVQIDGLSATVSDDK